MGGLAVRMGRPPVQMGSLAMPMGGLARNVPGRGTIFLRRTTGLQDFSVRLDFLLKKGRKKSDRTGETLGETLGEGNIGGCDTPNGFEYQRVKCRVSLTLQGSLVKRTRASYIPPNGGAGWHGAGPNIRKFG